MCGNAVLEDGEDCDVAVDVKGARCRPPGLEGECHFDCTTASDGIRPTCPPDMGCAADGLCRKPTGAFEPAEQLTSDASSWLSSADFDGDKRPEILSSEPVDQLGLARFRLHYFDDDAKFAETRTFPRFVTRPLAHKVTGDDLDDLIFSNGSIGLVPGRADHEWVPAAFSSYVVPSSGLRAVGVRKEQVGGPEGLPLVSFTTIDGVSGLYRASSVLELSVRLPRPVEDLAGDLLAADLFTGSGSPCSEVVVAFRGETRLRVFDVCEPAKDLTRADADWRQTATEHRIELDGRQIDTGPLSGDVDGDGHLDVVFGSGGAPYVLYGDGTKLGPDVTTLELRSLGATMAPVLPMPVAMGDVSGDGVADYVLPQYLLISQPAFDGSGIVHAPSSGNVGEPWTLAQIADLNGNGFPDIVVASAGVPGYMFHNGSGGPHVIGARVATARPLRFMDTGDFDGDLISDLAIVEEAATSQGKQTLSVAFGAADSLPMRATRVAEVEGVDQLGQCSVAGMEVLFLATTRHATSQGTFTLFDGSPDRLPFASYALVTFSVDTRIQNIIAASLAFGSFSHPGSKDLLAVGTDLLGPAWTQWLVPDIGGLVEPPRLLDWSPPAGVSPLRSHGMQSAFSVASAAADLDRDGLHEALWLMPSVGGCALVVSDIDAQRGSAETQVVELGASCLEPELGVSDLDQDGDPDVLLLIGSVAADEQSRLEVLWNDGEGFSAPERTRLSDEHGDTLRSFSVLEARPAVAFVTGSGLYLAELDSKARRFSRPELVAELEDGQSVVVTDPNVDGQPDLVVADAAGVRLLKAQLR